MPDYLLRPFFLWQAPKQKGAVPSNSQQGWGLVWCSPWPGCTNHQTVRSAGGLRPISGVELPFYRPTYRTLLGHVRSQSLLQGLEVYPQR